jgi:hypothetical protein
MASSLVELNSMLDSVIPGINKVRAAKKRMFEGRSRWRQSLILASLF